MITSVVDDDVTPEILFIALDSEVARIRFMESWLSDCGLEFQRKSGVVIDSHMMTDRYDQEERMKRFGYDLTRSEIGCFLAHRSCWKLAAKKTKRTLILESDVFPVNVKLFEQFIRELQLLSCGYDVIRLHGIFERNELIARTICLGPFGTKLVQSLGDPMGAGAYIVTPDAAAQLLSSSEKFYEPVDVFLAATWKHKLRLRSLKPYPMRLAEFESVIGERKRPKQSLVQRLKIELSRSRDDLRRLAYLPWHFFR